MKKLSLIVCLSLLFGIQSVYATNVTIAQTQDTLAQRHPILALLTSYGIRQAYSGYVGKLESDVADPADMADFALLLLVPEAIGDQGPITNAALLLGSTYIKHSSQVPPAATATAAAFQASPINPLWYSAALSHVNTGIRNATSPWVETWSNKTMFADYSNATQYLVPGVANLAPFLGYYLVTGSTQGLLGALAKGAGEKAAYVAYDGLENLNAICVRKGVNNEIWVKPLAHIGTWVELSAGGYALWKIAEEPLVASSVSSLAQNTVLKFVAKSCVEAGGYELASAAFSTIDVVTPEYAPYANPVLGGALAMSIAYIAKISGKKSLYQASPIVASAANGAALAGFLQVFSALFRLPGWIEDVPQNLWTKLKRSLPVAGFIPGTLFDDADELHPATFPKQDL